ncbi:MAG: hypothetical protein RL385_5072 [Pseudomonadota bacterium]|jgi:hypothetical protein
MREPRTHRARGSANEVRVALPVGVRRRSGRGRQRDSRAELPSQPRMNQSVGSSVVAR